MMGTKQTLSTQCFNRLLGAILNGEILPGEKLLCEELKKHYGVGMSPIREALSKLAATHLVTFEEHKGYSVAKINAAQLIDEIRSFAEIECLCFRQSMTHGDDSWEGSIIAALHCLKKLEDGKKVDFFSWAPINRRFHDALVGACPLNSLMEIRDHLYQRHQRYILLSYKFADESTIQANHKEHKQLAELAIAKKIEAGCEKMYAHIASGQEGLIKQLISKGLIDET